MRGISAYYYARENAELPAALITAIPGDERFDAWQAAKLAARMQAAAPRTPVLLRSDDGTLPRGDADLAEPAGRLRVREGERKARRPVDARDAHI